MDPPLLLFAQSLLIGLSIAAPVGPIGVLAIQRTLREGAAAGLATGLGAAVADALYGALGAFGATALVERLVGARVGLALAGAALLAWLAWRTWQQPVGLPAARTPSAGRLLAHFGSTFVLTLSNPATILSFVAVFGLLAAARAAPVSPVVMVAGVFAGSALWWLLLAGAVARLRRFFSPHWQRRINRAGALLLAALGAASLVAALFPRAR